MRVDIRGAAEFRAVSAQFAAEGRKGLGRHLRPALERAAGEVGRAVDAEAALVMPHRGGYQAALSGSLQHRASVRATAMTATLTLITFADGAGHRRDVPRLNKGELRHPVYGRGGRFTRFYPARKGRKARYPGEHYTRPWRATRITAGFHSRPVDRVAPKALEAGFGEAIDGLVARLAKG